MRDQEITVGSRWENIENEFEVKVFFVGKSQVVFRYVDGVEFSSEINVFLTNFTPIKETKEFYLYINSAGGVSWGEEQPQGSLANFKYRSEHTISFVEVEG